MDRCELLRSFGQESDKMIATLAIVLNALTTLATLLVVFNFVGWKREDRLREEQRLDAESLEKVHRFNQFYSNLQIQYLDFLKTAIRYPQAHVSVNDDDVPDEELSDENVSRRRVLYETLFILFEQAFVLKDLSPTLREQQW